MRTTELTTRYQALAQSVEALLGDRVARLPTSTGELGYQVESSNLLDVCRHLRDAQDLQFEMLMDLAGVDYLAYGRDEWQTAEASNRGFSRGVFREPDVDEASEELPEPVDYHPPFRFAVVYHLLSITRNHRLRLKVFCEQAQMPLIDSVTAVWSSADWYEREAFDLFGILFRGHPDLRRLLTDYGFIGHPFRKDFPLVGNVEMRFDPEKGRIVYEPVSIEPRTLVPKVIRDDNRYAAGIRETSAPGLSEGRADPSEGTGDA